MNKRQRKKLYLKKTGKNPPSQIALRGDSYNKVVGFANKTKKPHFRARRPYFKPEIIFASKENPIHKRECILTFPAPRGLVEAFKRISEGLSRKRHEYFLYVPKETSDYEKNTENVVSLTGILTKRRKARGK